MCYEEKLGCDWKKVEETSVSWIVRILLFLFWKGQADRSGKTHTIFKFMNSARPLDCTEKKFGAA